MSVTLVGMLCARDDGPCSLHEVRNISSGVCTPWFVWFLL